MPTTHTCSANTAPGQPCLCAVHVAGRRAAYQAFAKRAHIAPTGPRPGARAARASAGVVLHDYAHTARTWGAAALARVQAPGPRATA